MILMGSDYEPSKLPFEVDWYTLNLSRNKLGIELYFPAFFLLQVYKSSCQHLVFEVKNTKISLGGLKTGVKVEARF